MHLRAISLRDWKAFEAAHFAFPVPQGSRNVILIGGRNGFGKTSLFEAIALGLFGRDGMPLIHRAEVAGTEALRTTSFRDFMRRALHGRALAGGRDSCRIGLTFEDTNGEPIEVVRSFHYANDGTLRQRDFESVQILVGTARRPAAPGPDEPDREAWYRGWIGKTFMPAHLAHFFLFDGQAVATFANREMQGQVREGIKGLLGLPWLEQLAEDLRKYAVKRRSEVSGGLPEEVSKLEREIADIERRLEEARTRREKIQLDIISSESEREALTRELAGYGTGSRAKLEELISARSQKERAYGEAQEKLLRIVVDDLPLALAGSRLCRGVGARLQQEAARASWLAGMARGKGNADRVIDTVAGRIREMVPPIPPDQTAAIAAAVRDALELLWHPMPPDAAGAVRHPHAEGDAGGRVRQRLERAEKVSRAVMEELLGTMAASAQALQELEAQINASQTAAPDLEKKKERMTALNERIGGLNQERGERDAALRALEPLLRQRRTELGRFTEQMKGGERPLRLAKRAEHVAAMIDALVVDALPSQYDQVAEYMTKAIRAMAHRSDYLNRIAIEPDGTLRLLTPSQRDLREFDLSAGEKQVFTQALISAVVGVSGRTFPLIVDTPLGPLDDSHRINVLKHLAARTGQVFLISTDSEVVGPYLDAIRPRVLKAYRLENRRDRDLGVTESVEGYFPGEGV